MMPRGIARRILRNAPRGKIAQYVWQQEWLFHAALPEVREGLLPFRTPVFMRTLSSWLNKLVEADFVLEHFGEPCPSDEAVQERPGLQDAQIVAYFLHVRVRKPAGKRG
jgi:hypothetical protein